MTRLLQYWYFQYCALPWSTLHGSLCSHSALSHSSMLSDCQIWGIHTIPQTEVWRVNHTCPSFFLSHLFPLLYEASAELLCMWNLIEVWRCCRGLQGVTGGGGETQYHFGFDIHLPDRSQPSHTISLSWLKTKMIGDNMIWDAYSRGFKCQSLSLFQRWIRAHGSDLIDTGWGEWAVKEVRSNKAKPTPGQGSSVTVNDQAANFFLQI